MAIDRTKLVTEDGRPFDPMAYRIELEPIPLNEGGGWFATVPDLPGCMGDGETESGAIDDVRAAMLEWADAMINTGRTIAAPTRMHAEAAE